MRKLLLIITTFFYVISINAQNVFIPDTNFKNALLADTLINTNQDTEIQISEANSFTGGFSLEYYIYPVYDLTGIEFFTQMTILDCSNQPITILDLSYNTSLVWLWCIATEVTSINISNCTALEELYVTTNYSLSSLDVSNNVNLTKLYCGYNQLTSLDVSNNTSLTILDCSHNLLNTLNINSNILIDNFHCNDNQLTELSVKNGNNINFLYFQATNNPNLNCIEVDDPFWSNSNWILGIDPTSAFGFNCLYDLQNPNLINGSFIIDTNCVIDGNELGRKNVIVKAYPQNFYGVTNNLGEYTITTDTGAYTVDFMLNNPVVTPLCPSPNYHIVYFDSLGMDTTGINFFNEAAACALLTIDISSLERRRCSKDDTDIYFCNDGYADATGVEVHVEFPNYIDLISADYPYSIDSIGNYVFDIGYLAQGDCGEIHIVDSIFCVAGITGFTQCTKTWVTPKNDCANQVDTVSYNQWDHSSVMVEGECIGDSIIRFIITNTGSLGSGDMQQQSEYRIFRNALLVYTGSFQLMGQEELIIDIPGDGATYRLEADQHPYHPGNSHPNETIESCGIPYNSTGLVNIFPMDDEDFDVEIDCMVLIEAFDPNDKRVSPEGITNNNYVPQNTELDYVIRFQNTGTADAINIVVVDTLSEYLDISTFQQGVSSHPYTFDVRGQGQPVLLFQFFNIHLPDSATDEPNSHGFVKFKISPYDSLPNGTVVENTADIYFDYNAPVITNTTFVTISDTVLYGYPLVIQDTKEPINDIKIYPNPTTGKLNIVGDGIERIEILNIEGRMVYTGKENEIDLCQQAKGIYIVKVTTDRGVAVEKIVLE